MIYTVTLNPSIDYIVRLDELRQALQTEQQARNITIGGKGINVSCVLADSVSRAQRLVLLQDLPERLLKKVLKILKSQQILSHLKAEFQE